MIKIKSDRNGNAVPGDCNIFSTKKMKTAMMMFD